MSARYFIENGDTISEPMSLDWDGGRVSFLFFDAMGDPATVTGTPLVYQTPYQTGDLWSEVLLFSTGEWLFNGLASRVKIDLSGVSGFTTYRAVISRADEPFPMIPQGAFVGLRAMTMQPYTEANVKNGLQYFLRASWPLTDEILPGTTRKIYFQTGSKTILVKLREFQYIAEEMKIAIFAGPTGVTGGTPLTINNYNNVNPVTTTVLATKDVSTVSDGTQFSPDEFFFGSQSAPQRVAGAIPLGRERVLPPNSEFIVAISNTGTGNVRAEYFLDWYEGGTDLPIMVQ